MKHQFITHGILLSMVISSIGCTTTDSQTLSHQVTHASQKKQITSFSINKGFKVFNGTRYRNTTDLDQMGFVPFTTVYDVWKLTCDANSCSNVPDKETFKKVLTNYVSQFRSSEYITFDFEKIVIDSAYSEEQAKREVALIKQFIEWTREAYPHTKIGMYDYDFNNKFSSIKAQLYQHGGFDFFAPTLYQRWTSHATWCANLKAVVENDHAINPNLPIYAYISPYKAGKITSGFLSIAEWQGELFNASQTLNGVIIWTENTRNDTLNTNQSWLKDLHQMISKVKDQT